MKRRRKQRSDKGKKRGPRTPKTAKVAATTNVKQTAPAEPQQVIRHEGDLLVRRSISYVNYCWQDKLSDLKWARGFAKVTNGQQAGKSVFCANTPANVKLIKEWNGCAIQAVKNVPLAPA